LQTAEAGDDASMIDAFLRKAIEGRIASAGLDWVKVLHAELRADQKTFTIALQLDGEEVPVSLSAHYRVEDNDVVVESVAASKKWVTEAISYGLLKHGGRFPLPGGIVGRLARMFL
jgi:hypothetical protein